MSGKVLAAAAVIGAVSPWRSSRSQGRPPAPRSRRSNLAFIVEDMSGTKVDLATFAGKPLC